VKLLTRKTDYAIRAICYLSEYRDRVVPVGELVRHLRIPRAFLRKLMQSLGKNGVVRSCRGIAGGFSLKTDPGKIYLLDLIEIFQGPFSLNECVFKTALCPDRKRCPLKKKIDKIDKYVTYALGLITIKGLLRDKDRRG
jgi:Rrf2 family protein